MHQLFFFLFLIKLQAPPGNRVQLTFEGFEFAPRHVKPGSKTNGKCYLESVEIRLEDDRNGDHYCETDIKPGTVMTSQGNKAIVLVMADEKMLGKGLRMMVNFIDPYVTVAPSSTTMESASEAPPVTPNPSSVAPEGVDPTVPSNRINGFGGTTRRPVTPPAIISGTTESPFETTWREIIAAWRNRKPPTSPESNPGKSGGTGGGIGGIVPSTPRPSVMTTPPVPEWASGRGTIRPSTWVRGTTPSTPSLTFPPYIGSGGRVVVG